MGESSEKLVRKTSNIEKARLNNLIISNEGINACGQREEIVNQTEVIPEVKEHQLPTDFTSNSQEIQSEEKKTPEKPARKSNHTEIPQLKSKNPQNLPGTVPVMQPMMKMPDFQNELSKKLQKRLVENGENQESESEKTEDEKEKTEVKSVVGKLNPNKTAGLKLEMRLPGMQPPRMPLPNVQGPQAQTKTRSKSTGDNNEAKTNVDMNTTFEQHKVQLRKKQNKRAPTREHRRSKAMSAFPNELDVINSMDI